MHPCCMLLYFNLKNISYTKISTIVKSCRFFFEKVVSPRIFFAKVVSPCESQIECLKSMEGGLDIVLRYFEVLAYILAKYNAWVDITIPHIS